ncbi:hypothetical protein DPX16_21855 [Anabarilius grahami]|uniref:Uncharacterized protein n=1 Tax=Anabarilius grahami TaxID=495550 RepID=A0A3N0YC80_ANAGA|nr:hypothetical protein DPX16_21855 [Anabarilius grahami]
MSDTLQMALALSALGLLLVEEEKKKRMRKIRRKRTKWVKPWILQRQAQELISPIIQRTNTNYRDCISVGEHLMITLRFLATECCEVYMAGIDQEGQDHDTVPGRWREDPGLQQASLPRTTNSTTHAKRLRDKLCQYFNSDTGAVPFQWGKI